MRKIKIELETVNAAFDPVPGEEAARILHDLAEQLEIYDQVYPYYEEGKKVRI